MPIFTTWPVNVLGGNPFVKGSAIIRSVLIRSIDFGKALTENHNMSNEALIPHVNNLTNLFILEFFKFVWRCKKNLSNLF